MVEKRTLEQVDEELRKALEESEAASAYVEGFINVNLVDLARPKPPIYGEAYGKALEEENERREKLDKLLREWIQLRKERDDALYEQYAKHLEEERKGEFVAISPDGQLLIDKDRAKLRRRATEEFGKGNFALRKIGYDYILKWR